MGILDKIGIGKKDEQPKESQEKTQKNKSDKSAPSAKPVKDSSAKKGKKFTSNAHQHLVRPIISEKATMLSQDNKYIFEVAPAANKSEIKKSIEQVYKVGVENVNVVNVVGKTRRYGKSIGKTSDWKKAVVTVKKGQKIPGIIESAQQ